MKNKFWIVSMPTYSMVIFIILNIIVGIMITTIRIRLPLLRLSLRP